MALNPIQSSYEPVFVQGSTGPGLGGYELNSRADRIFAFDYNHSGKTDHLVFTRCLPGALWILRRGTNGDFVPVYKERNPGDITGQHHSRANIGGGFAFDYSHSGKLDHMVLYRPGSGLVSIATIVNERLVAVVLSPDGIGGYKMNSAKDVAFAFDYDHTGKQDHIVLYRPGRGTLWIIKHEKEIFRPVFQQGDPGRSELGQGIGGYDLKSDLDRAFAFDYDHSGNLDHIVLYRPGTGTIWILRNRRGVFDAVYRQGEPGSGIGGYDLNWSSDRVFAFDHDASGRADHLVLYRPGQGAISILKNFSGEFMPVYAQKDSGIGGYDLKAGVDLVFGFDYNSSGRSNHLVLYRPGTGIICILKPSLKQ